MNIYRFINSRDTREHLKKLNYSFNMQEAAYTVWKCKSATLREKEDAWNRIIETMPNCTLQKRLNMREISDFHAFLKNCIDIQKLMLQNFMRNDNCIYFFSVRYRNKAGNKCYYESDVFSDYTKCLNACIREISNFHCDRAVIERHTINNYYNTGNHSSSCVVNSHGEVMEIDCWQDIDDDSYDIYYAFQGMWFDFPTPFHCGDIVYNAISDDDPFVLTDISTWDEEKIRREVSAIEYPETFYQCCNRTLDNYRRKGDNGDMGAWGYGIIENNKNALRVLRDRYASNYLDLELYKKSYAEKDKLLLIIRSEYAYTKDREHCGIEALLNEYTSKFMEIVCKNQRSYMENFLWEG